MTVFGSVPSSPSPFLLLCFAFLSLAVVRPSSAFLVPSTVVRRARVSVGQPARPFQRRSCRIHGANDALQSSVRHNDGSARRLRSVVGKKPRARLDLVEINSEDDLRNFLERDDRLCFVKVYASWCKSCQKFGEQFRRLGNQHGDLVDTGNRDSAVRQGSIRMAEMEYGQNLILCQSLKIRKLPTVLVYSRGRKVDGFPCGPKKFPDLVRRTEQLIDMTDEQLRFEAEMYQGSQLGNDIIRDISVDRAISTPTSPAKVEGKVLPQQQEPIRTFLAGHNGKMPRRKRRFGIF